MVYAPPGFQGSRFHYWTYVNVLSSGLVGIPLIKEAGNEPIGTQEAIGWMVGSPGFGWIPEERKPFAAAVGDLKITFRRCPAAEMNIGLDSNHSSQPLFFSTTSRFPCNSGGF